MRGMRVCVLAPRSECVYVEAVQACVAPAVEMSRRAAAGPFAVAPPPHAALSRAHRCVSARVLGVGGVRGGV